MPRIGTAYGGFTAGADTRLLQREHATAGQLDEVEQDMGVWTETGNVVLCLRAMFLAAQEGAICATRGRHDPGTGILLCKCPLFD